jgi:tetratricopeptide (TPR) repeat protein
MGTPDDMVRQAQWLQRLDRVPEAIQAYERVLAQWPQLADCWFNLGVLQRKTRQLSAALASYQQALDLGISMPEEVHLNRGVIYSDYLRRNDLAETELQRALALNPRYPPALLNLANLYEDLGRRAEASALYERLLDCDPRSFEALARYANLQPLPVAGDQLVSRLRAALEQPSVSPAERASLGFALGRLLDGSGHYQEAFDAYVLANRDSRASAGTRRVNYNPKQQEDLVDRLIRSTLVQPAATSSGTQPAAMSLGTSTTNATPGTGPTPIFICGMFRSGSTLAERLLAQHPAVTAGGEMDFLPQCVATALAPFPQSMASLPRERISSLASQYLEEMTRLFPGAERITDKRPDNFLYLGLIKTLFPHAKIVHTTRDPLDNCLSIFFLHLDQRMSYALDLMDIGHYFGQYRRLMAHWKGLFASDIFDLSYDTLVREPSATAARLFAFLGLEWEDRYLELGESAGAVKTASVWQVREPLYTRSSGRAQHYAAQLASLRDYLADRVPGQT